MNRAISRISSWLLFTAFICVSAVAEVESVKYKVKIRGAKDGAVKKTIKESTVTWKQRKRQPSTEGQLRRRVEKDLPIIETILEANGYYDGTVSAEFDIDRKPIRVALNVELGEQYRYRLVRIDYSGMPDPEMKKIKPLIRPNKRVVAVKVFQEQQRIQDELTWIGYPFPKLTKRTISIDRENKVVDLELVFEPGQVAYFGKVDVRGMETLPESYIQRQIPWREGEKYNAKEVADFEKKMLGTGLFGSVRLTPKDQDGQTSAIPIEMQLKERSKRTIRLGINYSDIGPGGKVYWEHRSFLGKGERLEISSTWNPIKYSADAKLTRPGFLTANQAAVLEFELSRDTPDAYESQHAKTLAMIIRDFTPTVQGGLGVGYKFSDVEQFASSEKYQHILIPLQSKYDNRNDPLNPVRGGQAFGRTTFFEDTLGSDNFLKSEFEGRKYFMLWNTYRLSSAFRLTLGSIDGASIENVPADERFYAGGGGSIRGFEYQEVGPSVSGTPAGGNKKIEFSAELRLQPGNRLGYVAFLDGGTVYNDFSGSDYNRALSYGAGIGLRWFTSIGPLRADLAYPLNARESQIERFQFYISLGQAF